MPSTMFTFFPRQFLFDLKTPSSVFFPHTDSLTSPYAFLCDMAARPLGKTPGIAAHAFFCAIESFFSPSFFGLLLLLIAS